jgi:hypothetical protein
MEEGNAPSVVVDGKMGRLKLTVSEQHLRQLIEMDLPVPCIAKLLVTSTQTDQLRMQEYSIVVDEELDNLLATIKTSSPQLGWCENF